MGAQERMIRGQELYSVLKRTSGKAASEMVFTAMARMAAAAGKPREAYNVSLELLQGPQIPRLRTFVPALKAFAACGDVDGAFEVCVLSV